MQKKIGRFFGRAEDGAEYEVHVFCEFTDVAPPESPHPDWQPGTYEFRTPTGRAVERVDEGVYVLVAAGIVIRSDDPGAI